MEAAVSTRGPQEQSRRSPASLRHVRPYRTSSSSSLSVSACSISSLVSNYPPPNGPLASYCGDQTYEDYEVFSRKFMRFGRIVCDCVSIDAGETLSRYVCGCGVVDGVAGRWCLPKTSWG